MSRIKIKKRDNNKKQRIPYDQELNDIKEWQDNVYNPGYYVGTGKLPYPMKNINRWPRLKLIYLVYSIAPILILVLATGFTWYKALSVLLVIAAITLIIWDSNRAIKRKH